MREIECERGLEDENGKFRKTTYIIGKLRKKHVENAYQTIFLSTFWYHKHELEIAQFGARAPRARTGRETLHIFNKVLIVKNKNNN